MKADIKSQETSKDFYPDPLAVKSVEQNMDFLPELLRVFLQELFSGNSKFLEIASVGQCIMQSTRPRVLMTPIQFGLAVLLYAEAYKINKPSLAICSRFFVFLLDYL